MAIYPKLDEFSDIIILLKISAFILLYGCDLLVKYSELKSVIKLLFLLIKIFKNDLLFCLKYLNLFKFLLLIM